LSEVSPAWLRYELPKLGIAGSNPALRILIQPLIQVNCRFAKLLSNA
jgi:hypothetical protein